MKRKEKIKFDMFETSDIDDELVNIENDFYIKSVIRNGKHSIKFAIPKEITAELNLKASDPCFFVKYSEGFYISFKYTPDTIQKNYKHRSLQAVGQYKTLYVVIPPFIIKLYREPIKYVKLLKTQGFKPYEWIIQFHTTDFI